jgi:hypothetical protein
MPAIPQGPRVVPVLWDHAIRSATEMISDGQDLSLVGSLTNNNRFLASGPVATWGNIYLLVHAIFSNYFTGPCEV